MSTGFMLGLYIGMALCCMATAILTTPKRNGK